MSKFNISQTTETTNRSGNPAYAMSDKSRLVTQVLTSFFNEAKFYGDNSDELTDTLQKVIASDPAFVSNLAVFARREFHMRSVAHVLTAFLAHETAGKPFVRRTVKGVTLRGDDVTEIMAFYLAAFGKPVPNSLKRAIGEVMTGFDEYTLAKYKGSGKSVKMRDLLCLCRPKPKDEAQAALWKRCLENQLATPVTWETQLSAKGNNAETWQALIESDKVGYMALLRNLRNIITANPSNIGKVYRTIQNPEAVRNSKQLPFRYLSAYKSVEEIAGSRVLNVLERAAAVSVENMPRLPGTTVIAVDTSGSMYSYVSEKSQVMCIEIAMLLGMMANRICDNSIFYTFDTEIVKERFSTDTPLLAECRNFRGGGGTDMGLPFKKMLDAHVKADRLIILSDNECNYPYSKPVQTLADEYRKKAGIDLWVHAIDLQGYGTQQFHGAKTNIIAGWSEKVLEFIPIAEQGAGSLEQRIAAYQWE